MKLLVDENLAPELSEQLSDLFPGSVHVTSVARCSERVHLSGLAHFDHLIWPLLTNHSLPHFAGIGSFRPGVSGA